MRFNDSNPENNGTERAFESHGSGCEWVWPTTGEPPYAPSDRFWITPKGRADLAAAMTPDEALAFAIAVLVRDSQLCPGQGQCFEQHPSCFERLEALETLRSLRAIIAAALA